MLDQEGAVKDKEKSSGDQDEAQSEGEDPTFPSHDDASIAEEAVPPGEHLPLPPGSPLVLERSLLILLRGSVLGWRLVQSGSGHGKRLCVDLLIIAIFHVALFPSRRLVSRSQQQHHRQSCMKGIK